MIQDSSYEQLVAVKRTAKDKILPILLVIFLVLFFFLGVLFIGMMAPLIALLFGIGLYFLYFSKLNVEYEYLFVNTSIDIDVIYNQKKRKPVMSLSLRDAEVICPKTSNTFKNYKNAEICDFSTQTDDKNVYAIIINADGKQKCVLLEPDQTSLAHLKNWGLSKFKEY